MANFVESFDGLFRASSVSDAALCLQLEMFMFLFRVIQRQVSDAWEKVVAGVESETKRKIKNDSNGKCRRPVTELLEAAPRSKNPTRAALRSENPTRAAASKRTAMKNARAFKKLVQKAEKPTARVVAMARASSEQQVEPLREISAQFWQRIGNFDIPKLTEDEKKEKRKEEAKARVIQTRFQKTTDILNGWQPDVVFKTCSIGFRLRQHAKRSVLANYAVQALGFTHIRSNPVNLAAMLWATGNLGTNEILGTSLHSFFKP